MIFTCLPFSGEISASFLHRLLRLFHVDGVGLQETGGAFPLSTMKTAFLQEYKELRITRVAGQQDGGTSAPWTISIRALVRQAAASSETYLNELIWREFYQMILWHFPKVGGRFVQAGV